MVFNLIEYESSLYGLKFLTVKTFKKLPLVKFWCCGGWGTPTEQKKSIVKNGKHAKSRGIGISKENFIVMKLLFLK